MIPFWKKLLSYFWEYKLETIQSDYSGWLEVSYSQNNYKLCTKNATYSYGNLYTSFKEAFEVVDIQNKRIENVLVLGLGIGSVIEQLNHHQFIKTIDVVDIDEKIIYLCNKYLQTNFTVNYIHQNALDFVQNKSQKKYDLILVDIFIDDQTPNEFLTDEFLLHLKAKMNNYGIILFSKLNVSETNREENDEFGKVFNKIFSKAFSISTEGNLIFVTRNNI